ncbi:MAG: MaoC family dehydratase N-terminal domain-containing protein [Deltaproteobacteria bacterium]|nr:MaoC family dehydratase N-terminal domain-containing protein [Deltaproteobacteria bacterium]
MTTSQEITKPLYFEDFYVGQKFITKARTVTESDVVNFAGLSWDHNPLHTDEEYASKTAYGRRIAHGLLGTAIHTGLAYQLTEGTLLAFLDLTWQFKLPIFIGDTIHVEQVVSELRDSSKEGRGILTFEKELINQRNEVVQTGTTTILLAKREYRIRV